MTEKQKYLLKLFREVDEICREHNLRYVLAGGGPFSGAPLSEPSGMRDLFPGMMTWIFICHAQTGRNL